MHSSPSLLCNHMMFSWWKGGWRRAGPEAWIRSQSLGIVLVVITSSLVHCVLGFKCLCAAICWILNGPLWLEWQELMHGHHNLCMIYSWKPRTVVMGWYHALSFGQTVGYMSKRRVARWGLRRQRAFGQGICTGLADQRELHGNNWALPGCRRAYFQLPDEAVDKQRVKL